MSHTTDAGVLSASRPATTTGQRTHRYLRLALVLLVVALLTAVAVEIAATGTVLPSISHYFYTPARNAFVGCLVAVSLSLLALSGRDLETTLLDVAAVFAPLIALIPTGYDDDPDALRPQCPTDAECLPADYLPDVHNGVVTYAIVTGLVVATALIVRAVARLPLRSTLIAGGIGVAVAAVLLLLAFAPGLREGFPFNRLLPVSMHFAVTTAFFASFAAVPLVHALRRDAPPDETPAPWQRAIYLAVPALLVVDLVLLFALMQAVPGFVFWAEAVALLLFAVFWLVQTIQRWHEPNPPSLL